MRRSSADIVEVFEPAVVGSRPAARAEHHGYVRVLPAHTVEYLVQAAHVVDVEVRLVAAQVLRVGTGHHAVAVPFE